MGPTMEIHRRTIAKGIVAVFVFNLLVMGVGALYSYQQAPGIPQEVVGPTKHHSPRR